MLRIRQAQPQDANILQQIYLDAAESTGCMPGAAAGSVSFQQIMGEEKIIVACDAHGDVVGFVSVFEVGSFIHFLFVDCKCQSQGIGRYLLASLEAWLPMPWHLKCIKANERAIKFYEVIGWKQIEEGNGPDGPYILMRKG